VKIVDDEKFAKSDSPERISTRAKMAAFSELLFVVLPFIVIAITLGHRGELYTIFSLPEWSIVSAVIIGQSMIRLVSVVLDTKPAYKEGILFILSLILVLLLVPSLVILAIILTSAGVTKLLAYAQASLFIVCAITFYGTSYLETVLRVSKD